MTKDSSTPRPWEISTDNDTGPNDDYFVEWINIGPVRTQSRRNITKEDEDNAQLVFRAVNRDHVFEELVKALEYCQWKLENTYEYIHQGYEPYHTKETYRQTEEAKQFEVAIKMSQEALSKASKLTEEKR